MKILINRKEINIMNKIENRKVAEVFRNYPEFILEKMMFLRQIILEVASETDGVNKLEETLRWGEPSYISKKASTIRIDWKKKKPNQYAVYFNCKTVLVETFKMVYKDKLKFEGKRAIVFNLEDKIPIEELKHCIALSLTYHSIKHLPMLGI